jgi:hypothetical protein
MNIVLTALAVVCGLCGLFVLLLTAGALLRAFNPDLVAADENRPWDH